MNETTAWVTVQDFVERVRNAKRNARPFQEPEGSNIFEAHAAREAYEHAVLAEVCEYVWPFLQQQQAKGNAWLRLGNGTSEPAAPSLFTVRRADQPVGMAIDLTVGTVGSARWQVEADDFSGPDDYQSESDVQHLSRHGQFLGCPVAIDRQACETALYEIQHGRLASESEIIAWAKEMKDFGGRPTSGMVIREYRRSFPGSKRINREDFWRLVSSELDLSTIGGNTSAKAKQRTEEFLTLKPHPQTSAKPT